MHLYRDAEEELKQCIDERPKGDGFPNKAYTNKNVAGILGAIKYVNFLNIYELLEPYKNGWQNEIRSIQKNPMYTDCSTVELIDNISKPGWFNTIMTLKFEDKDVSHFITTSELRTTLKKSLPDKYQGKQIICKNFV